MSNFNYGYEYQDLVAINIALTLLSARKKFKMVLDYKEQNKDKLDDIILEIENRKYKMQVKHNKNSGNLDKKHFEKKEGIFNIEKSVHNQKDDITPVFITNRKYSGDFLIKADKSEIFENVQLFKIDKNKISYENVDKIIVIPNYFNSTFKSDELGEIEKEIKNKIDYLGIGLYPNENITFKTVFHKLIIEFRNLRLKNKELDSTITYDKIIGIMGLILTYKELPQSFKIENEYNIINKNLYTDIFNNIHNNICIVGEPGIGKSWLVQNMVNNIFKPNEIKYIRYTFFRNIQDFSIKDRINKNVMIANIKKQIINYYGYEKMSNLYGSSLEEILDFLEENDEKITFIFDGLDHIDREYLIHSKELTKELTEVKNEIISISKKNCNVIIVSQPTKEIKTYLNNGFKKIEMPRFTVNETKMLSKKINLELNEENYKEICNKANGNPLYIRTILNNIKNDENIEFLKIINNNINSYYNYLLTNVDINQDIISLLINGYITLNIQELNQITGYSEEIIENKINKYLPILKKIVTDNSYTIYHESFRRFLLEKINLEGSNIKTLCYNKLAYWLIKKDYIFDTKTYNTYFQILYKAEEYEKIVSKCNYEFVLESFLNGYYAQVFSNLEIIGDSLKNINASPDKIIEYDILKNMVWYAKDNIEFEYESICQYYAKKFSYEKIHSILYTIDEEPILKASMGLALLYYCDNNNITLNWEPYILKYIKGEEKTFFEFKYYIRYQIITGNIEKYLNKVKLYPKSNDFEMDSIEIIKKELEIKKYNIDEHKIKDKEYLKFLKNYGTTYEVLDKKIINEKTFFYSSIGHKIYSIKNGSIKEIEEFQNKIPKVTDSYIHNWYKLMCKTYKLLKEKKNIDNYILDWIKEFFNNSNIFSNQGRMVDAIGLYDYMICFIEDILKNIKDKNVLKKVITVFIERASETTGYLRGTKMGPFTENKILDMLNNIKNKENQAIFFDTVYEYYVGEKLSGYHADIASIYLKIACLGYSYIRDEQASNLYKNAIKILLSYYHHKETTIYDLILLLDKIKDNKHKIIRLYDYIIEIKKRSDGRDTSEAIKEYLYFLNKYYPKEYILFYIDQLNKLEYDKNFFEYREYYIQQINKSVYFDETPLIRYFLNLIFKYNNKITATDIKYFMKAYDYLGKKKKLKKEIKTYFKKILKNYKSIITIDDEKLYYKAIKVLGKNKIIKAKKQHKKESSFSKEIKECINFNCIAEINSYYKKNSPKPSEFNQIKNFLCDDTISLHDKNILIDLTMENIISDSYILRNNEEVIKQLVFLIKRYDKEKYLYYLIKLFVFSIDGWGCLCTNIKLLEEALKYDKNKVEKLFYKFLVEAIISKEYPIYNQENKFIQSIEKINSNKVSDCINIMYDILDKRLPFTEKQDNIREIFTSDVNIKEILNTIFDNLDNVISKKLKKILLENIDNLQF